MSDPALVRYTFHDNGDGTGVIRSEYGSLAADNDQLLEVMYLWTGFGAMLTNPEALVHASRGGVSPLFIAATIFAWLANLVLIGGMALVLIWATAAADASERGDWFKSLQRPDVGGSCCDTSDCKQTLAEWRDGFWHARLPDGEWIPIPPNKIVTDIPSIDGEAYLCAAEWISGTWMIFCFIPPSPGS